uniref:Uncharacterized protein n=1 Tax=Rhizophora mucronata TaxID=61149 RepID=A0A2P2PNS8_RHIMU
MNRGFRHRETLVGLPVAC